MSDGPRFGSIPDTPIAAAFRKNVAEATAGVVTAPQSDGTTTVGLAMLPVTAADIITWAEQIKAVGVPLETPLDWGTGTPMVLALVFSRPQTEDETAAASAVDEMLLGDLKRV